MVGYGGNHELLGADATSHTSLGHPAMTVQTSDGRTHCSHKIRVSGRETGDPKLLTIQRSLNMAVSDQLLLGENLLQMSDARGDYD